MKHPITLLSLLLIIQLPASAQVDTILHGLKGKIIRAMEKSNAAPGTYYAGLKGNTLGTGLVYRSTDHGQTWHPLHDGQPIDPYVADIQAVAGSSLPGHTLYAGTWKNGLLKSDDGGRSWQKDVHFPSSDIRSIRIGRHNADLIYASTSSFGVVRSTDGGQHWQRNDPALVDSTFRFAWSIEVAPHSDDIIFAQTFSDGVWVSRDQGKTWQKSLDTEGKVCWDMHISDDGGDIWVASSQRGDSASAIYHSSDLGATWTSLPEVPQIGINQVSVSQRDGEETLVIGSWQDGIYIRRSGSWSKVDQRRPCRHRTHRSRWRSICHRQLGQWHLSCEVVVVHNHLRKW